MGAETEQERSTRRHQRTLFDRVAQLYEASRFGYPGSIIELAAATAGLGTGSAVLTPNDLTSLEQIRDRLAAFEISYNAIARPFTWTFTRTDLSDLLRRIDARDKTRPDALAA